MDTTTHDNHPYSELRSKLEELRVRAHLGGMDAHDKIEELSRELAALGRSVTQASAEATRRLRERIEALESLLIRD